MQPATRLRRLNIVFLLQPPTGTSCPFYSSLGLFKGMLPSALTEDYYAILEVHRDAGPELIVKSYRRLARKLHPDRNTRPDATQAFQQVW